MRKGLEPFLKSYGGGVVAVKNKEKEASRASSSGNVGDPLLLSKARNI